MLLVAFVLVNAPNCHLSLVLASVVQVDAVNCNTYARTFCGRLALEVGVLEKSLSLASIELVLMYIRSVKI